LGILLDQFKKDLGGQKYNKMAKSRQWLFNKMNEVKVNRSALMRSGSVADVFIGNLFFFFYDPKTKKTLPYYDRFPLVIPIEMYDDGFLGLNLHYLDPGLRVMLLDRLMDYANNKKMDKTTRLRVSYDLISNASRLEMAAPCIKRYLYSHIQSKFIPVESNEWEIACFLPSEQFVKADKKQVWKESRNNF
jgi:hypothetical protein